MLSLKTLDCDEGEEAIKSLQLAFDVPPLLRMFAKGVHAVVLDF